MTEFINIYPF